MTSPEKHPTYKRQRFLLSFLRSLDSEVSATDIQKLVFLNTMTGESGYYEFVPYKFGAYSFQLKEDLDILERDGFITQEQIRESTKITALGSYKKENDFQIVPERGDALIRRAYREYPYYAINSEITGRLFSGEELRHFNRERLAYSQREMTLFTIGYEGKSIEAFINLLIQNDIHLLCDVRRNPLSRKFGFSKSKLDHITQTVGIRYAHIPELGIESDQRGSLETLEDYEKLFSNYRATLSSRIIFLNKVNNLLSENSRIALMCYELEPTMCHRHIVRDYLVNANHVRSVDL